MNLPWTVVGAFFFVSLFGVSESAGSPCRRVFRNNPSCCLAMSDADARNACSVVTDKKEMCVCHDSCLSQGNCCPGWSRVCPPEANLHKAWCPVTRLEEGALSARERTTIGDHLQPFSARQSFWERRKSRGRFPWHRLHYDYATFGREPHNRREQLNDLERISDFLQTNRTHEDDDVMGRQRLRHRYKWPWSAVGRIVFQYFPKYSRLPVMGSCTGSLIGPRHFLTAAHCLFSRSSRSWHHQVHVFLTHGEDTSVEDQEPLHWTRMIIPQSYKVFGNKDSDFGIIVLGTEFSSESWLAFGSSSSHSTSLELIGYDYYAMWRQGNCSMSLIDERSSAEQPIVNHDCYGTPGMSGSPLVGEKSTLQLSSNSLSPPQQTQHIIHALHTHAYRRQQSRALKINLCIFHTLCGWLNYNDNRSSQESENSENFRKSLGPACANMNSFIPSLIRRR